MTSLALEPSRLSVPASAVRLVLACVLSLLLHLLLLGVPVNPTGGRPDAATLPTVIQARIEPLAPHTPPVPDITADSAITDIAAPAAAPVTAAPPPAPAAPSPSAGVQVPLMQDPQYYNVSELDVKPEALVNDLPAYPEAAASAGIRKGQVKVQLYIDEFGTVNEVRVVSADPPGYFETTVMEYFRQKRFSPGRLHGVPVKTRGVVPVNFEMGLSAPGVPDTAR